MASVSVRGISKVIFDLIASMKAIVISFAERRTKSLETSGEYNKTWKTHSDSEIYDKSPKKISDQNMLPSSGIIQK